MSKWKLLKSAVCEGKRDHNSHSSIHRFRGFSFVTKSKTIWKGYCAHYNVSRDNIQDIIPCGKRYMEQVDCAECLFILHAPTDQVFRDLTVFIVSAESQGHLRRYEGSPPTSNIFFGDLMGVNIADEQTNALYTISVYVLHKAFVPLLRRCSFWSYLHCDSATRIFTRESPVDARVNTKAVLSNKIHGVDNTGNICVWPTESVMLCALSGNDALAEIIRGKSVIELGGGLTALAGLGLASLGIPRNVIVTDGHPDCVVNQKVCIAMNRQQAAGVLGTRTAASDKVAYMGSKIVNIASHKLNWSRSSFQEDFVAMQNSREVGDLFDVVIASDCLFFREFHEDLVAVLVALLKPVSGVALFFQPKRDGTMHQFLALCGDIFSIEIRENYYEMLSEARKHQFSIMCTETDNAASSIIAAQALGDSASSTRSTSSPEHKKFSSNQSTSTTGYDDDIHYPVLVMLRWR